MQYHIESSGSPTLLQEQVFQASVKRERRYRVSICKVIEGQCWDGQPDYRVSAPTFPRHDNPSAVFARHDSSTWGFLGPVKVLHVSHTHVIFVYILRYHGDDMKPQLGQHLVWMLSVLNSKVNCAENPAVQIFRGVVFTEKTAFSQYTTFNRAYGVPTSMKNNPVKYI